MTAAVDSGVVTEGPLPVMTATGTIDFGDVDLADAHVTSVTPGGSGYLGTFVADVTERLNRRRQRAGELGVPGQQPAAAVAPGRPAAGADLHRRDRRRPRRDRVAARDDHHQRHQRRRRDHRRHGGECRRGRRRGQRYPRHTGRHRRSLSPPMSTTRTTSGRRLALRPQAPTATAAT